MIKQKHLASTLVRYFSKRILFLLFSFNLFSLSVVAQEEKNINDINFPAAVIDMKLVLAKSSAFSIAGGGETLSAINKYINTDDVSYCSTGGGAFLEFMEGKTLPSISALNAQNTGR